MTALSFASGSALLCVAVAVYKLVNLSKYIAQARSTGLPYTIVAALETEVVAKLSTPIFRLIYHNRLARGEGWPNWCRFTMMDWGWEDKRRAHEEYGEVFLVVSPEGLICYCADADLSWDVMHRRNEFTKPRDKYSKTQLTSLYRVLISPNKQKSWSRTDRTWSPQRARSTIFMSVSRRLPSAMLVGQMIWYGRRRLLKRGN